MAFAQGSRSQLTYVVESTFGTTPGTPAMLTLPINSHSLNLTKETVESGEIRADRQISVSRHGNKQVSGDISVEFRADDYDDFLESAFFNTFSGNTLKVGTTPQYMSIEDGMLDISQYRLFTGCAVRQMTMNVSPNAMVTATFGMVGKTMTASGSSVDSSPTAASGNQPFDSFTGTITEDGGTIATVTSLEFTIDNGLQPTFVIGSAVTPQLEYGRARVTGTINAYFENLTLYNKFINETGSSLEFSLTDGNTGGTYTFTFGTIKYNGGDLPLQNEQSRILSLPFIALYDDSDATTLKLVVT